MLDSLGTVTDKIVLEVRRTKFGCRGEDRVLDFEVEKGMKCRGRADHHTSPLLVVHCLCNSSQHLLLPVEARIANLDTWYSQDVVARNRRILTGCTCWPCALPAYGHSSGPQSQVWSGDQAMCRACSLSRHMSSLASVAVCQCSRTVPEFVVLEE